MGLKAWLLLFLLVCWLLLCCCCVMAMGSLLRWLPSPSPSPYPFPSLCLSSYPNSPAAATSALQPLLQFIYLCMQARLVCCPALPVSSVESPRHSLSWCSRKRGAASSGAAQQAHLPWRWWQRKRGAAGRGGRRRLEKGGASGEGEEWEGA